MSADGNAGQRLVVVDVAGGAHGLVEDVMHAAQGERIVKEIGEEFRHAAERAVADEQQAEHQLPEPELGDGESKKDAIGINGVGGEGLVEGLMGLVELLIDE